MCGRLAATFWSIFGSSRYAENKTKLVKFETFHITSFGKFLDAKNVNSKHSLHMVKLVRSERQEIARVARLGGYQGGNRKIEWVVKDYDGNYGLE